MINGGRIEVPLKSSATMPHERPTPNPASNVRPPIDPGAIGGIAQCKRNGGRGSVPVTIDGDKITRVVKPRQIGHLTKNETIGLMKAKMPKPFKRQTVRFAKGTNGTRDDVDREIEDGQTIHCQPRPHRFAIRHGCFGPRIVPRGINGIRAGTIGAQKPVQGRNLFRSLDHSRETCVPKQHLVGNVRWLRDTTDAIPAHKQCATYRTTFNQSANHMKAVDKPGTPQPNVKGQAVLPQVKTSVQKARRGGRNGRRHLRHENTGFKRLSRPMPRMTQGIGGVRGQILRGKHTNMAALMNARHALKLTDATLAQRLHKGGVRYYSLGHRCGNRGNAHVIEGSGQRHGMPRVTARP